MGAMISPYDFGVTYIEVSFKSVYSTHLNSEQLLDSDSPVATCLWKGNRFEYNTS